MKSIASSIFEPKEYTSAKILQIIVLVTLEKQTAVDLDAFTKQFVFGKPIKFNFHPKISYHISFFFLAL